MFFGRIAFVKVIVSDDVEQILPQAEGIKNARMTVRSLKNAPNVFC
jgi:hypothetical protein